MNTTSPIPSDYTAELAARVATFRRAEVLRRSNRRRAVCLAILAPWRLPALFRTIAEMRADTEADRRAIASFTIPHIKPNPSEP